MTRGLERRIGWAEAAVGADGARDDEETWRAALAELGTEQLSDLAAECLVAHGADPATAREGWLNSWRLGVRGQGSTWAELVPLLPEAVRLHVADLRRRVEACGVPVEVAARLEDHEFRHRVDAVADRLWPPEGWTYGDGYAWVLTRLAAGMSEAELTHVAYYGPERGPEMAACAVARLAHDGRA